MSTTSNTNTVTLRMPATAEYVRLVRLASADAGSRAGLDYEEIEDLKIAVTELCHLLMGDGAQGEMTVELRASPGEVDVVGRCEHPGTALVSELADVILARVVDSHSLCSEESARRFDLSKRSRVSPSAST